VEKRQKTEEQLKADIFNIYSHYFNEPSSDRRQVNFSRICGLIISWCTDYLMIKANEMGEEIFHVVLRLVKDDNTKVPKDEKEFFWYLKKALDNAKNEYCRNNEDSTVHIPKATLEKLKMVEKIIIAIESRTGKKFTEYERQQEISKWFSIAEYTELMNLKNISSIDINYRTDDDDNEINLLNSKVKPLYMENASTDPLDEYFTKLERTEFRNALEEVLQNSQDRTRDCYRSLFTAYCIDKSMIIEDIIPLLDSEILEAYQMNGNVPKNYEIYLKYHPEVKKDSSSVRSTEMLKKFLVSFKEALEQKNPENFHKNH
jgi:hypothetical protein